VNTGKARGKTLPPRHALARGARILGLVCGAALPLSAWAELSNEALLGLGLRSRPAYDGSAAQRVELVPVLRYFGPLAFARSTQGVLEAGLRTELAPGLHAGAQLVYEPGRQSSESAFLDTHHAADIGRGASVGLHLEWDHTFGPMPVTLLVRARKATDAALGAQADLRLSAGVFQSGRFGAGVFAQGVWADARAARSYYGVSSLAAGATGLPAFEAGRGWMNRSVGLLWSVEFSPKWVLVGSLESRSLQGAAAHSPLAERSSNRYLSAGLAYRP
jgi:outer membrane scaffolding protein for murein synthesis (MipA/OmpV family)